MITMTDLYKLKYNILQNRQASGYGKAGNNCAQAKKDKEELEKMRKEMTDSLMSQLKASTKKSNSTTESDTQNSINQLLSASKTNSSKLQISDEIVSISKSAMDKLKETQQQKLAAAKEAISNHYKTQSSNNNNNTYSRPTSGTSNAESTSNN